MNKRIAARLGALCAAGTAVAAGLWFAQPEPANAADHNDPPARVDGQAAADDIADLYAWHGTDTVTVVLTFAGPTAPAAGQSGNYDPDVLYTVNIDNTGDDIADISTYVRFAQNDLGDWGVQVTNLPGEAAPVEGAVETAIDAPNGGKVWSGLADDPFFFDLTGFVTTVTTGTLSFDSTRDFFAGQNVTAVVLEMPLTAAQGAGTNLSIWSTTGRI